MAHNFPVPRNGPTDSTSGGANQVDGVIFPSLSRAQNGGDGSGNYFSQEYLNSGALGIRVFIDVTNVGGGPGTVTVKLQNLDPASGKWIDVPACTSGSINSVSSKIMTIFPGTTESSSEVEISEPLGMRWRLVATVGTNAVTFSVGADYLGK